jgi:hypothetical protein
MYIPFHHQGDISLNGNSILLSGYMMQEKKGAVFLLPLNLRGHTYSIPTSQGHGILGHSNRGLPCYEILDNVLAVTRNIRKGENHGKGDCLAACSLIGL